MFKVTSNINTGQFKCMYVLYEIRQMLFTEVYIVKEYFLYMKVSSF